MNWWSERLYEPKLPILKMMNSLSSTFGIATTPSGSTVTKTCIPPCADHQTWTQQIRNIISKSLGIFRTWSLRTSRFSVLKINFSVLSNLLFWFSPTSKLPFFNCNVKLAGTCNSHPKKQKGEQISIQLENAATSNNANT